MRASFTSLPAIGLSSLGKSFIVLNMPVSSPDLPKTSTLMTASSLLSRALAILSFARATMSFSLSFIGPPKKINPGNKSRGVVVTLYHPSSLRKETRSLLQSITGLPGRISVSLASVDFAVNILGARVLSAVRTLSVVCASSYAAY